MVGYSKDCDAIPAYYHDHSIVIRAADRPPLQAFNQNQPCSNSEESFFCQPESSFEAAFNAGSPDPILCALLAASGFQEAARPGVQIQSPTRRTASPASSSSTSLLRNSYASSIATPSTLSPGYYPSTPTSSTALTQNDVGFHIPAAPWSSDVSFASLDNSVEPTSLRPELPHKCPETACTWAFAFERSLK